MLGFVGASGYVLPQQPAMAPPSVPIIQASQCCPNCGRFFKRLPRNHILHCGKKPPGIDVGIGSEDSDDVSSSLLSSVVSSMSVDDKEKSSSFGHLSNDTASEHDKIPSFISICFSSETSLTESWVEKDSAGSNASRRSKESLGFFLDDVLSDEESSRSSTCSLLDFEDSSLDDSDSSLSSGFIDDDAASKKSALTSNDVGLSHVHPCEAKLLDLMRQYSLPHDAYTSLMEWARDGVKSGYDFSCNRNRDASMRLLLKHNTPPHALLKKKTVSHEGMRDVVVYVFSLLDNIKRLCSMDHLMNDSNWEYCDSSEYGDLNTGNWWKKTEEDMLYDVKDIRDDEIPHVLMPIILFIDGTHCDLKGRLTAEPVLCTIGNINLAKRKSSDAWFMLGMLPKKNMTSAEIKQARKGRGTKSAPTELYAKCIEEVLSELRNFQEMESLTGEGVLINVSGKGFVRAHFHIAFIIGDTLGQDMLCC